MERRFRGVLNGVYIGGDLEGVVEADEEEREVLRELEGLSRFMLVKVEGVVFSFSAVPTLFLMCEERDVDMSRMRVSLLFLRKV